MPSVTEITVAQFSRLIGLPQTPAIVDVRIDDDYRVDPRLLPGSVRRDYRAIEQWASAYRGKSVVVVCQKGQKLSEGTAAWLRHGGIEAQTLEGGFEAWKKAGELLVRTDKLPERDAQGRTVWVTRTRPKVDRIACPWLIRRFIDPTAVFLFVLPAEVPVGFFDEQFGPGALIPAAEDTDFIVRAYLASVVVEYVPDMTVYHHHGRKSETEGKRLMRGYMVGTGGLCTKHLFKNPSLCRRDRSGTIDESPANPHQHQAFDLSQADKLFHCALGAVIYVLMRLRNIVWKS